MKPHTLLGMLALCTTLDSHASAIHDDSLIRKLRDAPARLHQEGGAAGFGRVYDSALSAAGAYALTDPSGVPAPASGMLLALGAGLLGVSSALRRSRAD